MDRRRFLQLGASVGVGAVVAGSPVASAFARGRAPARSVATGGVYEPVDLFPAGVLSGDPTADGIVLWTRIDPARARGATEVVWELSTDPAFSPGATIASGKKATRAQDDHTVHAEVAGLLAATTYWYRFRVGDVTSPVGRTRTLPSGPVDHLRIAYFSCQRYVHGYYNAHADLAARAHQPETDVDLVICLGDYVYEAGPADDVVVAGRVDPDLPTVTLEDYRRQYHLYRTDLDLQAMHAAFPFAGIFDNHDGFSGPTDPAGPGARAAFFEQMPVRRSAEDPNRQYRSFALGGLCELFLLDERQYRDPTPEGGDNPIGTSSVEQPLMVAPGRTMLGAGQKDWLLSGLERSGATWKILGSQLVFAPFRSERYPEVQATAGDGPQRNAGRYVNLISWDGFQSERREIVDHLNDRSISDVVVISGDAHFWTTSEVSTDHDDPAAPQVLTEFAGSSITSANAGEEPGLPGNDVIRPVVAGANPLSLRHIDAVTHGYGIIELTSDRATVSYVICPITRRGAASSVLARFEVDRGTATIRQVEGSDFMPRTDPADPTPSDPSPEPTVTPPDASGAVPVPGQPAYTG